jgi:hypothetical protein
VQRQYDWVQSALFLQAFLTSKIADMHGDRAATLDDDD